MYNKRIINIFVFTIGVGVALLTAGKCCAQDQDASIKFEDITVIFKGMVVDNQAPVNSHDDGTTKSFQAWIGYKLTPGLIQIQSDQLIKITINERFENSITLINDGQHCDLTDWEHYLSPWQQLTGLKEGDYQGISLPYNDPKIRQFPNVTKDLLMKQVENHCGTEWLVLFKNYKNVFTEPFAVAVSKVYLRINGINAHTGKAVIRNIVISVPVGD